MELFIASNAIVRFSDSHLQSSVQLNVNKHKHIHLENKKEKYNYTSAKSIANF